MTPAQAITLRLAGFVGRHARPERPCVASGWPVRPSLSTCPICNRPMRCVCDGPRRAHIPDHLGLPAVTVRAVERD